MLRLLQFLIFGHVHKYEIIDKGHVVDIDDDGRKCVYGNWYDLKCSHCGKVKRSSLLT